MTINLDAIKARAEAATEGPWRLDGPWWIDDPSDPDCPAALAMVTGPGRVGIMVPERTDANDADAEFIAHARTDVPALVAEVERLQAVVARVEALAVTVDNRMMATAKPAEIWAALRGEDACEGSPFCPGDTHTEGCYSLAWTDEERQQCTDALCLTPCTECARAALAEAHVDEFERLRAVVTRMEALADWHETRADGAMLFPGDGNVLIATKAATVHRDAAARLRAALTEAGGE